MNDIPVFVFGASGHAKVVIDILRKQRRYSVAGIIVKDRHATPESFFGAPVLGADEDIPELSGKHGVTTAIVAIGDNYIRESVIQDLLLRYPWLQFATAIHPSAQIGEQVRIGKGSVIMAGVVINAGTEIGEYCIVNSSASIDHDNRIDDFASVAPGAVTGGNVTIGRSAAVCLGARINHGREIGEYAVVGSGSVVLADVPARTVAYGVPARVVRTRVHGDRYL